MTDFMEAIFIEATEDSPEVDLNQNNNAFTITGRSFPEDPFSFYQPIIGWLKDYVKNPKTETVFEFKLDYFNTASSKQIFELFLVLERLAKKNSLKIKWFYREGDTDMYNSGDIFAKLIKIDIEMIEYL